MAQDYKIKYKNSEDDVPHVKYVHAVDLSTAETIFRHSWIHEHGDNDTIDNPKIVDVEVLDDGCWKHEQE